MESRSEPQRFSLGRIPPRTPGRSDAQVPQDASLGEARYARCGHLYFYVEPDRTDVAYGLIDIEISIQIRRDGEVWLEAYCVGDGYQSGRGSGRDCPLVFEVRSGGRKLAAVQWHYPMVLCGHLDPMNFAARTTLSAGDFAVADEIYLPAVGTVAESCSGAPVNFGGPAGHGH